MTRHTQVLSFRGAVNAEVDMWNIPTWILGWKDTAPKTVKLENWNYRSRQSDVKYRFSPADQQMQLSFFIVHLASIPPSLICGQSSMLLSSLFC